MNLNLGNPGVLLSALVDELRIVLEDRVTLDNLSGDRGENIGGRFDGFDSSNRFAGTDFPAFFG